MNPLTSVFNFLLALVPTIIGILIVLWIERQRRPKLRISLGEPGRIKEKDPLGRPETTWLHVNVMNESMPRWLSWVYDRDPALMCRAWLTFHHLDGLKVFDREMNARWSETSEPSVDLKQTSEGKVASLSNFQSSVDIPPGEYTTLDIVNRIKPETDCYGWNNESYIHNWRHPAWKLEKGRYLVRVRIKTGGRESIEAFLLVNDVAYEDFRVESTSRELKKRLNL